MKERLKCFDPDCDGTLLLKFEISHKPSLGTFNTPVREYQYECDKCGLLVRKVKHLEKFTGVAKKAHVERLRALGYLV